MNQVIMSGRVATDVKYRLTQNGNAVADFLLAVPKNFKKNKDGNVPTDFPKVVAWGKKAELCRDYLTKGRACLIHGHVTTEQYDKNGQTIRSTYITAENVEFLGYRRQYAEGVPKQDNEADNTDVGMPDLSDLSYRNIPDEEIPF